MNKIFKRDFSMQGGNGGDDDDDKPWWRRYKFFSDEKNNGDNGDNDEESNDYLYSYHEDSFNYDEESNHSNNEDKTIISNNQIETNIPEENVLTEIINLNDNYNRSTIDIGTTNSLLDFIQNNYYILILIFIGIGVVGSMLWYYHPFIIKYIRNFFNWIRGSLTITESATHSPSAITSEVAEQIQEVENLEKEVETFEKEVEQEILEIENAQVFQAEQITNEHSISNLQKKIGILSRVNAPLYLKILRIILFIVKFIKKGLKRK
jgi:hypothetical protein